MLISNADRIDLEERALRVREHVVRMATGGGCFLGAALSCTDILVHLYARVLRVDPGMLGDPERDYVLLSKGHAVPALYGALVERGFFQKGRLRNHLSTNDLVYWNPNRALPGVEFHAGSLGHLPAVGVGIALEAKLGGGKSRVFVIAGDGELDEGSVWEALRVAAAKKIDNWILVVDCNQAGVAEALEPKLTAFGASVVRANGHDHDALSNAFSTLPPAAGKPTVVLCDTVRAKGLPSLEGKAESSFCNFTSEEVEARLFELRGESEPSPSSEDQADR